VFLEILASIIYNLTSLQSSSQDIVEMFLGACSGNLGLMNRAGCPTSAYTAVGAAFSLEGYWVQADILWQLRNTGLGRWAPLLYVLAVLGGFIGLATGSPPRNYMWWLMGPVIYDFLIFTLVPVSGVQWAIGQQPQNMREVWRIAEPGLRNKNIFMSDLLSYGNPLSPGPAGYSGSADEGGARSGPLILTNLMGPEIDVNVSMVFLWYDQLISDTIQWFIRWTGVGIHLPTAGAIGGGSFGGYVTVPILSDLIPGLQATNLPSAAASSGVTQGQWQELSKNKWSILESVTGAKLHNPDLRDAFVTFLSSECGDRLRESIDMARYAAAANSSPKNLPQSVLKGGNSSERIATVRRRLESQNIPTPMSLRDFLKGEASLGSIRAFTGPAGFFREGGPVDSQVIERDSINCWRMLTLLMHGFRWEAGHAYHQIVRSQTDLQCTTSLIGSIYGQQWEDLWGILVGGILSGGDIPSIEDHIVYVLFYGWDIKNVSGDIFSGALGINFTGQLPDREDLKTFLKNLILAHMFRNEWALAPQGINARYAVGRQTETFAEAQLRTVGQKSKFGEFHVWAQMIPYVQGVLLYVLAIAYPFACILIIIPGWHKTLFTWMSFYAWVKLWDLGFAVVESIEKTLWAMVGNSYDAMGINQRIMSMSNWGSVDVECPTAEAAGGMFGIPWLPSIPGLTEPGAGCGFLLNPGEDPCSIPIVTLTGGSATAYGLLGWENVLQTFDTLLVLASNVEYDIGNAYYIYIVAALYFAVPAATGQVVLGAKAGAAGMVSNMIGGSSGEAGKGAASGFTSDAQARGMANNATLAQEATAKSMRKHGLADAAIGAGNMATEAGIGQSLHGAIATGAGHRSAMIEKGMKSEGSQLSAMQGVQRALGGVIGAATGGGTGDSQSGNGKDGAVARAIGRGAFDAGFTVAQNNVTQTGLGAQARQTQIQAGANVGGFASGAEQAAHNLNSQRQGAHAQHAAGMDAWKAQRNFANQMGGTTAAMGMFPGTFSPGQKPQEMTGLAMSGMLGGGTQNKANFADPNQAGGLFGQIAAQSGALNTAYGSASMPYNPRNQAQLLNSIPQGTAQWGQQVGGRVAGSTDIAGDAQRFHSTKPTPTNN